MITGQNGFLYNELKDKFEDSDDMLFLLGGPTFDFPLSINDAARLHIYVHQTIKLIDENINKYIVFASSTGVDDIDLKHEGFMAYSIAKLYLENYIMTFCDDYLILRIGTIISDDKEIMKRMKGTRIQNRILSGNFKNIPLIDKYLDLDQFINETINIIKNHKCGIHEYSLRTLKLSELVKLTK